jgi:hypothetical protein
MEEDVRGSAASFRAVACIGELSDLRHVTLSGYADDSLEILTFASVRIPRGHGSPPGIAHLLTAISWNCSPLRIFRDFQGAVRIVERLTSRRMESLLLELLTLRPRSDDLLEFLTFERGDHISWNSSPFASRSPSPGNPHHPGTAHPGVRERSIAQNFTFT